MLTAGSESLPRLSFAVTPAPWVTVSLYFRLLTTPSPPWSPIWKPAPPLLSVPAVRDAASSLATCTVPWSVIRSTFQLVATTPVLRSEEHTSELQSRFDLVCRLLLEKKK